MKRTTLLLISLYLVCIKPGFSQTADAHFTPGSLNPRLTALQATMVLTEVDENLFWPMYRQYEKERQMPATRTFLEGSDSKDTKSFVKQIFDGQAENLSLKRQYFNRISGSLNGTLALQFLQTEALLDLMVKSQLYDSQAWEHPLWRSEMLEDENVKMLSMEESLGLTKEQALRFRSLFVEFEFDYSRIVGHQLVWFEQYVEDITDLTPAQCKKLGNEFLTMQQNELRLLERMFKSMLETFGEEVALKYMALEDYFTMAAKLQTWDSHFLASR